MMKKHTQVFLLLKICVVAFVANGSQIHCNTAIIKKVLFIKM